MTIAILGYGKEGKAVENYFKKRNKTFQIFDNFTNEDLEKIDFSQYEMVFRSPSVKPIKKNWNSITKYFFNNCKCPIIGVTGTKGKGTTCSMITAILKGLSKNVYLVGNIGNPAIDVLDEITPEDVVVYEMSSFQLWDLEKSPKIAVVLRIEPDHLNVHDGFDDYLNSKSHIVEFQSETDTCIYFKNNENTKSVVEKAKSKKYTYPIEEKSETLKIILNSLKVPGEHNKENAEAALLACSKYFDQDFESFLSKNQEKLIEIFQNFEGLPHRCQFIGEFNNVLYYDDNFSASSPAMDVAIKTFSDHPIFIIAGGKDRGLDLTPHKISLFQSESVQKAILIGETKTLLIKNEDPEKYILAETLEEAVKTAKSLAEDYHRNHPDEKPVVLMSPGAASFDMFKNFEERGQIFQSLVQSLNKEEKFRFLDYDFNEATNTASFRYQGIDGIIFEEKVKFERKENSEYDKEVLEKALFLSFILVGTSYYKTHPTKNISLDAKLSESQANFFNKVYQEGMSQFAFENNLKRENLAHFENSNVKTSSKSYSGKGILVPQTGGKDSLLTAKLLKNSENISFWYASSTNSYPTILDSLNHSIQVASRSIDKENLNKSLENNGKNGHIPITYIFESFALIQAILNNQNIVLVSIGREGNEPHAFIEDLPVNHQWNKTWEAEKLLQNYVHENISEDIQIGSPLRGFSELKIAELFTKYCWQDFSDKFSSCNVANYKQGYENQNLSWCGNCAKCANTYLLFAPFVDRAEISKIFPEDLFEKHSLENDFKGLLGIDNHIKPFECVAEIDELRKAYQMKKPNYSNLPFEVPTPDPNYDYQKLSEHRSSLKDLLELS